MEPIVAFSVGGLTLLLGGALYLLVVTTQRMLRGNGGLLLAKAVTSQGLTLALDGELAAFDTALAVRRCVLCSAHERCGQLVRAGNWSELGSICVNTGYMSRLTRAGGRY
jgi:hypothetical protein